MNVDQFFPLDTNISGGIYQYSQERNNAAGILGIKWPENGFDCYLL